MDSIENRVVFEDNHLLIFNKLPGEIVQGDKTGDQPLVDTLKGFLKTKHNKPGNVFLGLTQRLDRPTSGLVIFAKTSKALSRVNDQLKKRAIKKTYWAVTEKALPTTSGKLVDYLKKNNQQNKSYPFPSAIKDSKKAILNYSLLGNSDRYYLYEIDLETGRHHQIRVQLSARGAFIKGDVKYGAKRPNKYGSIHLHAHSLKFIHPVKKEPISITAPPPNDPVWNHFSSLFSS